jgi:hypothetical protein
MRRLRAMVLSCCVSASMAAGGPVHAQTEPTPAPAPAAPESAPAAPESAPPAASPDASATIPVCKPAEPPHHAKRKHKRPTRTQIAVEPPPPSNTVETRPDAIIDAAVIDMDRPVMSILGKKVQNPKGEDLGRVVDVLADSTGQVRVAIIDFGGFLGVGNRRIAVDWPLLRFDPGAGDKPITLAVSREKLQSAPEYKDSARPRILSPN